MNRLLVLAIILFVFGAVGCLSPANETDDTNTPQPTIEPTATVRPAGTAVVATATPQATPPLPAAVASYLEEVVAIIKTHSIMANELDWDEYEARVYRVANENQPQTIAEAYTIIELALTFLGDRHSFLVTPADAATWTGAAQSNQLPVRGELMNGRYGYLRIPPYRGADPDEMALFAADAHRLIAEIDAENPCGWIVDLRSNRGGNMWPMLAAVGPLLGADVVGGLIDANENQASWTYQNGAAGINGEPMVTVPATSLYRLQVPLPPVAVLISGQTASSGEATAVAFAGRPDAVLIGNASAGLTTSNSMFELSDGALLFLTTSTFADRTGRAYGDKIEPDMLITTEVLAAGEAWLSEQPGCASEN